MMQDEGRKGLSAAQGTAAVWGSLAGAVLGGTCWLWIMAAVCGDWTGFGALLAASLAVYIGAGRAAAMNPRRYFRVAALAAGTCGLLNVTAVLLRWDAWIAQYQAGPLARANPINNAMSSGRLLVMIVPLYTFLTLMMLMRERALRRNDPER